ILSPSAVPYSAVPYSAVPYSAGPYSAGPYSAVPTSADATAYSSEHSQADGATLPKASPTLPMLLPQTPLPLAEFILWVQHHANALGHCCVTKLSFNTISQGMAILRSLDD
ncbi:MAG: DUF4144 family protein, partial [Shewanella sp.]